MGKYLERAKELRNDPGVHYNCAQAVLAAFGPDAGLPEEAACRITANFADGTWPVWNRRGRHCRRLLPCCS